LGYHHTYLKHLSNIQYIKDIQLTSIINHQSTMFAIPMTATCQLGPTFQPEQITFYTYIQPPVTRLDSNGFYQPINCTHPAPAVPPTVTRLDSNGFYCDDSPTLSVSLEDNNEFPGLPIKPNKIVSDALGLIIARQQPAPRVAPVRRKIDFNDEDDDELPSLPEHW